MGYYIQGPLRGKADYIRTHEEDVTVLKTPEAARAAYEEGMGVVVVVENGPFDAAAFAYSKDELESFLRPDDQRPVTLLAMDRQKAEELSGYAEAMDRKRAE